MGRILPQIDRDETDRADDRQNNKKYDNLSHSKSSYLLRMRLFQIITNAKRKQITIYRIPHFSGKANIYKFKIAASQLG